MLAIKEYAKPKTFICELNVYDLKVDQHAYQRIEKSAIKDYVRNFNPDLLNVIVVSERDNGGLYVIDGQQRVAACRIVGYKMIKAQVFIGLTLKQEAKMFLELNKGINLTAIEKFKAKLTKEDPAAIELNNIIEASGYKVSRSAKGENTDYTVNPVSAIERIWKDGAGDPWTIRTMLRVTGEAWGGTPKGLTAETVKGFNSFLSRYKSELDVDRLISALAKTTPQRIVANGQKYRDLFSTVSGQAVGIGIWKEYNRGLRSNKLSDWVE